MGDAVQGFWVLGYGMGVYDASRDKSSLNLVNPPYRDMVSKTHWALVAPSMPTTIAGYRR